jgi:hypothetical protein
MFVRVVHAVVVLFSAPSSRCGRRRPDELASHGTRRRCGGRDLLRCRHVVLVPICIGVLPMAQGHLAKRLQPTGRGAASFPPRLDGPRQVAEGLLVSGYPHGIAGGALLLALACAPAMVHQEPVLYSTTAREHGLDSRQRIWEAERLPTVSILRATPDQDNTALGFGFLMMECFVDLAQARGFRYFVILDEWPEFSRSQPGLELGHGRWVHQQSRRGHRARVPGVLQPTSPVRRSASGPARAVLASL